LRVVRVSARAGSTTAIGIATSNNVLIGFISRRMAVFPLSRGSTPFHSRPNVARPLPRLPCGKIKIFGSALRAVSRLASDPLRTSLRRRCVPTKAANWLPGSAAPDVG
jgi:hypothetical protein